MTRGVVWNGLFALLAAIFGSTLAIVHDDESYACVGFFLACFWAWGAANNFKS
jgi:hypothetical protein